MYERFDRSYRHHLPKMLPILAPPSYPRVDHRASTSIYHLQRRDDYRCTISKPSPHYTIVTISIHLHKHIDPDRVPCWRLRRKLVALDQPICTHRCTSDPAFFRAVRRRTSSVCISSGCNMSAWITQDYDTGNIRLNARTHYVGGLSEEDAVLLETVKSRAEAGGGLRYE